MSFELDVDEVREAIDWYCFQARHGLSPGGGDPDPWGPSIDELDKVWQLVQKLSRDGWVPMPKVGKYPQDDRAIAVVYEWDEVVLLAPMTVQAHPDYGDVPECRPWVKDHVAAALRVLMGIMHEDLTAQDAEDAVAAVVDLV